MKLEQCDMRAAADRVMAICGIEPQRPPAPLDAGRPKRFMEEIEEWLDVLIGHQNGESETVWKTRVVKALKTKILASYRNGQASKQRGAA